jgi:hypothetical protein
MTSIAEAMQAAEWDDKKCESIHYKRNSGGEIIALAIYLFKTKSHRAQLEKKLFCGKITQ